MKKLPRFSHPDLLVGSDTYDDAGVYRLRPDLAIIQTLDFFTPMVDDPYLFGQIAAANALSDIYAMGGTPITAMNIAAFPHCLSEQVLADILLGGVSKVIEAGALLIGGHTIEDDEPKYGLSVTGTAHPDDITANSGGRPGDLLFLTKKLGTGIIATAIKGGLLTMEEAIPVAQGMATLNKDGAICMIKAGVKGATDITGFGFLGHLWELADASGCGAEVWADTLPIWPQALEYANMGLLPAGGHRNRAYLGEKIVADPDVPQNVLDCMVDPQTSGGLLMAVPPEKAMLLREELNKLGVFYAVIGQLNGFPGQIRICKNLSSKD